MQISAGARRCIRPSSSSRLSSSTHFFRNTIAPQISQWIIYFSYIYLISRLCWFTVCFKLIQKIASICLFFNILKQSNQIHTICWINNLRLTSLKICLSTWIINYLNLYLIGLRDLRSLVLFGFQGPLTSRHTVRRAFANWASSARGSQLKSGPCKIEEALLHSRMWVFQKGQPWERNE